MRRNLLLLICLFILFGESCNNSNNNNYEEIETISNTIFEHNELLIHDFTVKYVVTEPRYKSYYKLYRSFKKQLSSIVEEVDYLSNFKHCQIDSQLHNEFNNLWNTVDSVYDSLVDTTIINNKDTITQKTYLEEYLKPVKEKIEKCSSKTDLNIIKLYLGLIDKEILEFLYEKAEQNMILVDLIKPITFRNGKNLDCYISAMDTMHYPIILIGKFEPIEMENNYLYYNPVQIVDTVFFNKEKAIINQDILKGNQAVLFYTLPDGIRKTYKIK
jgi:hypothetical protein